MKPPTPTSPTPTPPTPSSTATSALGAPPPDGGALLGGIDLDRLPRLSIAELRRLWTEHIGPRTPPPVQKCMLVRELAWRVQERRYGGLDAETAKLLKAAMRSAVASLKARPAGLEGLGPPPMRRTAAARSLQTSSKLLRTWRGRVHEVEVLDSGKRFRYRGQEFRTLSEVARFITGTHRSGPRFFGLSNRRRNNEEADE